jgi:hypothetical protein
MSSSAATSKVQAGSHVVPYAHSEVERPVELVDMKQQSDFDDEKKVSHSEV